MCPLLFGHAQSAHTERRVGRVALPKLGIKGISFIGSLQWSGSSKGIFFPVAEAVEKLYESFFALCGLRRCVGRRTRYRRLSLGRCLLPNAREATIEATFTAIYLPRVFSARSASVSHLSAISMKRDLCSEVRAASANRMQSAALLRNWTKMSKCASISVDMGTVRTLCPRNAFRSRTEARTSGQPKSDRLSVMGHALCLAQPAPDFRAQMNRVLAQPCLLARQGWYAIPVRIPTSTAGIAGAPQRFILDLPLWFGSDTPRT
jgi:hypothetical protein